MKGDRKHPDCLLIVFLKEVLGQPFQVHAGKADSRAPWWSTESEIPQLILFHSKA